MIENKDRKSIFSSSIDVTDNLRFVFEVFEVSGAFEISASGNHHVVEISSSNSDKTKSTKLELLDSTVVMPCVRYELYKNPDDDKRVGIKGYTTDGKLSVYIECDGIYVHRKIFNSSYFGHMDKNKKSIPNESWRSKRKRGSLNR